jgi:hypothetical protein
LAGTGRIHPVRFTETDYTHCYSQKDKNDGT